MLYIFADLLYSYFISIFCALDKDDLELLLLVDTVCGGVCCLLKSLGNVLGRNFTSR